ncbi:MAG: energy transducer TonB, partial [Pyrinomonadaceae bacterium]
VNVAVTIDADGNVLTAHAVSGDPLFREAAEEAARASTFSPTILAGKKVQVSGIIVYNFVAR